MADKANTVSGSFFIILCVVMISFMLINLTQSLAIPYSVVDEESDCQSDSQSFLSNLRLLEIKQCSLSKYNRIYIIDIALGNQSFKLKISTVIKGIWIADKEYKSEGYDRQKSNTFQLLEELHTNKIGKGSIASDTLYLPAIDMSLFSFPFFLVSLPKTSILNYQGIFGIGYNEEDESPINSKSTFDFFDFFAKAIPDSKKMIGLRSTSISKGELIIGGFPEHLKKNMKKYRTCPIVFEESKQYSWVCLLNSIYFSDGNMVKINEKVDFIPGGNFLYVTPEFLQYIGEHYFAKELRTNICILNKDGIYQEIICNQNDFDPLNIGAISFVFGKMTIKLNPEQLFFRKENKLHCVIGAREYSNEWAFSPGLLLNYYIMFDKENDKIGFYYSDLED